MTGHSKKAPLDVPASALGADVVPMVLAAGLATRLRPLTEKRAKATVPFLNRTLLDYTLDWLARAGFRRVVINLHHAPDSITRRYGRKGFGMRIDYSHEPEILGTGGGPRRAAKSLGEHVLLINGDVLTLASLGPLFRRHFETGSMATLGLFTGGTARGYPQVAATPSGRLAAFPDRLSEAPEEATVRGVFCGIHLLRREALRLLPESRFSSVVSDLYSVLTGAGFELGAVPLSGAWYEIGDPGRYIDHQLEALRHGAAPLAVRGKERYVAGGYVAHDGHLESTNLRAPFLVGSGARVQAGARLEGCVVADRARIAPGSRLDETVVWEDASIGPGARLRRCVVMDGVRVGGGTEAVERVFTPEGPVEFGRALASMP